MSNTLKSKFQQKSPRDRIEFPLSNFTGVDNSADASSVEDNISPDSLNTVLDNTGSVQTRKGYTKLLTTASALGNPIQGMRQYYNNSTATKQLIYASGANLYRYDNAGGSVQIGGPYTAGKQWDFDVYNDTLYAVNGADGIFQYAGGAITQVSGVNGPVGDAISLFPQYIRIHKNRSWVVPPNSSTIYFSNAGDAGTFPINNFIQVNTNDGQVITGIEVLVDSLVVFKTDSIWYITGEPQGSGNSTVVGNLSLRRANSEVGCVAFRTIQKVGAVLLFMSRSGLYVLQNYSSSIISSSINGTFRTGMNLNFQSLSWAIYSPYEKKYIVGYPSIVATTPDKAICYDLLVKRYTLWDDVPGSCAVNFRFNQTDTVLVGDPVKGLIYQHFTGYADIAGDNGIATAGTTLTLTDSTKAWTTGQFIDASVTIISGTGAGQSAIISANTATQLTFAPAFTTAPDTTSIYSIGAYQNYWKSKIFDFKAPAMSKRFKYLKLFMDSESNYNILAGSSIDFQPLSFNLPSQSLASSAVSWGQGGIVWGQAGISWGNRFSLFKRIGLAGQGRYIQIIFGSVSSNQPWRVFEYTLTYKLKKERPT